MIDEKLFKTVSIQLEDPEDWNVFYRDEFIGKIRLVTRENNHWYHYQTDTFSYHEDTFEQAYKEVVHSFSMKYKKYFSFVRRFNKGELVYFKKDGE